MFQDLLLLIIFSFFISQVYTYCSPGTTTNFATDNLNQVQTNQRTLNVTANNNRVKTKTRIYLPGLTTSFDIPTTTIPFDTCETNFDSTQNYGWGSDFFFTKFDSNVANLISIIIHSTQNVNSIAFNYENDITETYGEQIGKETIIDLVNKEVIAINIRSYTSINNIQFLIYDRYDHTSVWTPALGGLGGYAYQINAQMIKYQSSKFKITSISGTTDGSVINNLKFGYTYQRCNPFESMPPMPPTPPLPTITTSTILSTTTTEMSTTTIIPGECKTLNGRSSLFGTDGSQYFLTQFNVKISDLKSIEIRSGEVVYALNFIYKNGNSLYHGYTLKHDVKIVLTINLEDKQIAAVHFRSGLWINNIQFLIYDLSNKTYTWTRAFGGQGGDQTFIDAQSVAPLSSNFQITSLSGSAHPFDFIRTLRVGYSYKQCNPAEPGPTIPPTPVQPIDTTILPLTSTIRFAINLFTTTI